MSSSMAATTWVNPMTPPPIMDGGHHSNAESADEFPSSVTVNVNKPKTGRLAKAGEAARAKATQAANVFSSSAEANRQQDLLESEQRNKWCGILHPDSKATSAYNQMHMALLLYMLVVLPVRAAFMVVPQFGSGAFMFDLFIDIAIVIDMMLNCRKYYYDHARLITDKATITGHYMRGWFFIDLLSVLPFNYIVMAATAQGSNLANSTHFARLLRIARFARLLKLAKATQLKGAVQVQYTKAPIYYGLGSAWKNMRVACLG
jgi:hypothetical protein